ncbi:Aldo-keto reductase family 1 member [Wickerhamomyces ciferrii]|uniref:Aldo-keto reductase family 1 member n=1 Tax=Wickerhamomyces ciferrii (strain ATCC 14091 / BCRC 22168 / CBS 111 / JCM 3599 / NBRC 0793 / NRRL Y-1031 F-60-10) TaxID=1206466 RepID=K0KXI1_WICCF|nr:Aldo-keto reductase family 1 member [Wickerhamomyces ciferrii]CCH46189.1 Aldo-keto reductase family 1 member [Wickerhamomyces ciferrii]
MSLKDLRPIGPTNIPVSGKLNDLPKLLLGGAVFNQQFNDNPENLPVEEMLKLAFSKGINGIDTSPYYGPSEILLGNALKNIKPEFPRENYYIITKAGRVKLNDFDYKPESIRASVERSLERLDTDYLDVVYLHDVEFVSENEIYEALKLLKSLKSKGVIRHIGISGYPVDFLYKIAKTSADHPEIGPLDAILSYSNFNLQNEILRDYIDKFYHDAHLQKLLTGSILSMSLLRSGPTHEFHPASKELRDKCQQVAQLTNSKGVELADLATRYAIKEFLPYGPVVLGVSNLNELENAIDQYWNAVDGKIDDSELVKEVKQAFGKHLNETWESGIPH